MPEANPQHARAIGEKLRAARRQRKMSLRELALKAEISASMLSQIETGKAFPSVRSIYSIAAALVVPVDYFFPIQASPASAALESDSIKPSEVTASELRHAKVNGKTDASLDFAPRGPSSTPIVHAAERPTIELRGGISWSRLTALAESEAEFLEITYAPSATSGAHMSHHEGREFGLVLEGELTVELGFEAYTLQAGDSIIFDSMTPHRLTNKSAQPVCALWVVLNRT
jgi:transcriptional regulator with XRE-family HTH domain